MTDEVKNVGTQASGPEVRIAEQDGYATRPVGPDGETIRVQIKAGKPIPADAELEGGGKTRAAEESGGGGKGKKD